jgi:hypothetical protein
MVINQAKRVKLKMRGHKFRSCVNWQGLLKQKGVKETSVKQGLGILYL